MENTIESLEQKLSITEKMVRELLTRFEELDLGKQEIIGDLNDCSRWIKRSASTIYKMTSEKRIPHYKNGKHLLFNRADILRWLEKDRQLTIEELNAEADQDLQRHVKSSWK
jgi:excisionase family DNA binding protein